VFFSKADLEAKSNEMIAISGTVEAKNLEITNLTEALTNKASEIQDHEELLKQAKEKNQQLEEEYTKLNDSATMVKVRKCIFTFVNTKSVLIAMDKGIQTKFKHCLFNSYTTAARDFADIRPSR